MEGHCEESRRDGEAISARKQQDREFGAYRNCHSRGRENPVDYRSDEAWIPAFAGMTGNAKKSGMKLSTPLRSYLSIDPFKNQPTMKIKLILSSILALTLLGACKSPTTIVVNNDVGTIQGKVVVNVNCSPLSNASGTTVHIEGTAFSATTDSLGDWTLNNVPAGIYNIMITKPGFDTDLITQDQFSGAGTQFFENGSISSALPLLDSVLITSIQITKKDSVEYRDSVVNLKDSLGHWTGDSTIYYIYDTVGYEYSLSITFTMNGPDSAISFVPTLKDVTPDSSNLNQDYMNFSQAATTILRNQNLVRSGIIYSWLWAYPQGVYQPGSPRPGDNIVVTTTPSSTCSGRHVTTVSKGFVLP